MKGVFLVLDGIADEPCKVLDGLTPLEAAKTPNLDYLAGKSKLDYCYTLKEGVVPQSSSAMISLFGHDPNFAPRGPFETIGAGIKLTKGDLAFRCNFATVEDLDALELLDRRAGRTLTTKESSILAKAINEKVKLPFKFEFYSTNQHRGVLVFRGGFSDNISNVDPDYGLGVGNSRSARKVKFSKPLDEDDDGKLSADLVNQFVRQSHNILDRHPLNLARAKKGLFSANFLLCRDAGNESPSFKKLKGKWMALGYMPLEIGLAKSMKMDVFKFEYPKMKGIDVYSNLYTGLKKAIKYSVKMLKKHKNKQDYFYIHIKETDIPGHDNKPLDKVKMIELLDQRLFSFLKKYIEKSEAKLVLLGDHTTSCKRKAHTADPVPVMYYNPQDLKKSEKRFTEKDGLEGKKMIGRKLLEKTLLSK